MTRVPGSLLTRMAGNITMLVLALGCIIALAVWSGLGIRSIVERLVATPIWLIGALMLLSMAHVALSARKWQLVLYTVSPGIDRRKAYGFSFACTAASAFLSQVMTAYLSSTVVRSWAARRYHGIALGKGAASSVFEQTFDVAVIAVLLVPTLVAWSQGGTVLQWALGVGVATLAGAGLLLISNRLLSAFPLFATMRIKLQQCIPVPRDGNEHVLISEPLMIRLYALSLLRFLILMARIPLVIFALGFPVSLWDGAQGFSIVQATQLISFVPGNLGLQEWSWVGALTFRGYGVDTGTAFAIALRIVSMVATTLTTVLVLLPFLFPRRAAG